MRRLWNDILNLFYPRLCLLCGRPLVEGEEQICLHCLAQLPYIRYESQGQIDSWFAGKSEIQYARAYLRYEKGSSVQRMIHDLKYHGNKELAYLLGRWAFLRLRAEQNPLCSADVLLPIPLHPKKKRQRGYNQAEWIAKGIASVGRSLHLGLRRSFAGQAGVAGRRRVDHWRHLQFVCLRRG